MTQQRIWIPAVLTVVCGIPSTAIAQFHLSEPEADERSAATSADSAGAQGNYSRTTDRKTSAPIRKTRVPTELEPNVISSDRAGQLEPAPNSSSTQRGTAKQGIPLLTNDAAPPAFFSGPVPRTRDLAEDAALNDVCNVGDRCWAVGERGVVCISDDCGRSWYTRVTPQECSLQSVCFLTDRTGWIAGFRSTPGSTQTTALLLHSRDGGRTFHDLSEESPAAIATGRIPLMALPGIVCIRFFGLEDAVAVTLPFHSRTGHGIFRTEDGGHSWSPIWADRVGGPWMAAEFISPTAGLVVGAHQSYAAVVSNQAVVINPPQATLRRMLGVSLSVSGEGWIVGDGATIMKTSDGGVTWSAPEETLATETAELLDLSTVAHRDSLVLAAGNPGSIILRSTSGGKRWTLQPVAEAGSVRRLKFVSATDVLAVGSFGKILRSGDAGVTWTAVRSSGFRSGLLNLVTNADAASWQLLASISGEYGVRSVILQCSQPLGEAGLQNQNNSAAMSERTRLALTQLGGNEAASDWMFPRTKPEQARASAQLIAEWTRETDGRLRRLLPLRLARDLRTWRPSAVVIEPVSGDDAVAAILRDVTPLAVKLAVSSGPETSGLQALALEPWATDRVFRRVSPEQRSVPAFDDGDLLPSLQTTIGLLCDSALEIFPHELNADRRVRRQADYELAFASDETVAVESLFAGLSPEALNDARRPYQPRSHAEKAALSRSLESANRETAAISAQLTSASVPDAVIGQLQSIAGNLPVSLALKELKDLARLNLERNNMEACMAVLQELTRRFPNSVDAAEAAEMLFLFYSSAECRHHRLRSILNPSLSPPPAGPPETSSESESAPAPAGLLVQPEIQAAASLPFSAGAGNSLSALQEKWDQQAAVAYSLTANRRAAESSTQGTNPVVALRLAASLRSQNRPGEYNSVLAELSQRDDQYGVFARSEMQVSNPAGTPVLPVYNLPRKNEQPFLDGRLTDVLWENSEELFLRPFSPPADSFSEDSLPRPKLHEPSTSSLIMLTWDGEFLYVAAKLERPDVNRRFVELASHRSHDAAHQERDRVELEIDTDRDFHTSFMFTVDEAGLTSERCWMFEKWNPRWFVAVDADESAWRVEAAIPIAELSAVPAKPGDLWTIRLRRVFPGVLKHELESTAPVSTDGTGLVRFIRERPADRSRNSGKVTKP